MAHRFEITKDLEVGASPEQVWEAIATGPGMDSWFMGRSQIEPREGGTVRWSIGDYTDESTVTTWDPPRRFASTSTAAPDGTFHRFDYRIEDRTDALYRFISGFDGTVVIGHHLFADGVDRDEAERALRSWLTLVFGPPAGDAEASG